MPHTFNTNFIIENNGELISANYIAKLYKLKYITYSLYYNEKNFEFIKRHLFFNECKILALKCNMQDIFARQKINNNFFGSITILNDGTIYTNTNLKSRFSIEQTSLVDVVCQEFTEIISWRKTRLYVKPCRSCVFNNLCPPISNYDYALNRYDLCLLEDNN